jgi:RNA polymerase sigma factor (sigma-70 family)
LATYSEEFFTTGLRNQDKKVLSMLYKMHYPPVLNHIMNNSGTEQEAKDVYQEAMIVFYERMQDKNFELSCKIKTYLFEVSRRLWLKRLYQKGKFVGRIEENDVFPEVVTELGIAEENENRFHSMYLSLSQLGEPCKSILEEFYFRNSTMEEITVKFGYTNPDNAKNQKYKCLQRLKKSFFSNYKPEFNERGK